MMEFFDDIIREQKKRSLENNRRVKKVVWGRDGFRQLKKFLAAVIICPHGLYCVTCDYGDKKVDSLLKKGFTFLGVEHAWDRRKKGFLLSFEEVPYKNYTEREA